MKITEENIDRLDGLDSTELTLLSETLQKHPYSSTLAIALTKAYEAKGDVRYESLIQRAALLSNSRRQLHSFLFEEETEVRLTDTIDTSDPALAEIPDDEPIELISRVDEDADGTQQLPMEALEEVESTSDVDAQEVDDPFELQYLAEALNAGAALDLIDRLDALDERDTLIQEDVPETSKTAEEVAPEKDDAQLAKNESTPMVTEAIEEEVEYAVDAVPAKQSFSRWMTTLSDVVDIQKDVETSSPSAAEPSDPSRVINTPQSFKEAASIIDNFIEKEDDIVPKRAEFFNPAKAAKSSLLDREDIVTETLAKVYAQQGNISKAISTYEKLSLLHPEKSSYFAAFIEKLKTD